MCQPEESLGPRVDYLLKKEYHQICFNPAKRHSLQRMTQLPEHLPSLTEPALEASLDNRLLQAYISQVYQHYNIEDPIKRELRLANKTMPPEPSTANKSAEKAESTFRTEEGEKPSRTKLKLQRLKDQYRQDSQDIVSTHFPQTRQRRVSETLMGRSRLNRQIGYRTKQRIFFKTLTTEDDWQLARPHVKHHFLIERPGSPNLLIRFNSPAHRPAHCPSPPQEVPVVFRYCPMCEQPILEHNIPHHEAACRPIQQAYEMSFPQLEAVVRQKVQRLEEQVQRDILSQQEDSVARQFSEMKAMIGQWLQKEQSLDFSRIRSRFANFSLENYDKLAKLHWFRHLLANIVLERERAH